MDKCHASYPIPSRPRHIGGSLRTPHHNCWLQMLNLYWRPANPHINLDAVVCCAGAIVGLFESAEDREVNNSALLRSRWHCRKERSFVRTGTRPFASTYPLLCGPDILGEVVPHRVGSGDCLVRVERPRRLALRTFDNIGRSLVGAAACARSGLLRTPRPTSVIATRRFIRPRSSFKPSLESPMSFASGTR